MNKLVCALLASAIAFSPAVATVNAPIPVNAYITVGGLDWAWGAPLPGSGFPNALDFQGTLGWRIPTVTELASAPLATDFIFRGANVPLGGSDPISGSSFQASNSNLNGAAACATGYFNVSYTHCDWQDGKGQVYGPWAGSPGAASYADQLYVRAAVSGAVPESATWAMMIGGFALAGAAMRRRASKISFA